MHLVRVLRVITGQQRHCPQQQQQPAVGRTDYFSTVGLRSTGTRWPAPGSIISPAGWLAAEAGRVSSLHTGTPLHTYRISSTCPDAISFNRSPASTC